MKTVQVWQHIIMQGSKVWGCKYLLHCPGQCFLLFEVYLLGKGSLNNWHYLELWLKAGKWFSQKKWRQVEKWSGTSDTEYLATFIFWKRKKMVFENLSKQKNFWGLGFLVWRFSFVWRKKRRIKNLQNETKYFRVDANPYFFNSRDPPRSPKCCCFCFPSCFKFVCMCVYFTTDLFDSTKHELWLSQ